MKVILSVQPVRYPLTGIGRYTLELAGHLANISDIEALKLFGEEAFVNETGKPQEMQSAPASFVQLLKRRLARNPFLLEIYRKRVHSRRASALKGYEDHIYHGPNYYLPPFGGRSVVTIHDLSVFTMPEHHPKERVSFLRKEVEFALTQASMLITDAEFTRHEVANYFGWPIDRIGVATLAGGEDFSPRGEEITAPCLKQYGLQPGQYSLYAGTIEPRKNLERLLIAYEKLAPAVRARYPLVMAGYKGWANEAIMERLDRAIREGWAHYLGFVPDADLPYLFAGARLFVFPSLYEGFGLPVLEAMASGVPVLTSSSSTLPEVAGGAAAICHPEDIEGMTAALLKGLVDETWRSSAIELGLSQASKFSWQKCAEETAEVYRKVLQL